MFFKSIVLIALLATVTANLFKPHRGYVLPLFDNRVDTAVEARDGEFPWHVSLQWGWLSGYSHFCSGAIVNSRWIVTAGQCGLSVPSYGGLLVKAGKFNLKTTEAHEQAVHVDKIIVYPSYNGDISSYDIALIKLENPLVLNSWVKAINLTNTTATLTGNATLSGWGSTSRTSTPIIPNRLQKAVLPIMFYTDCKKAVEKLTGPNPVDSFNICTGTHDNGFPAYIGDTGSPLVITNSTTNLPQLAGIVTWGILPTGTSEAPLIYTAIKPYVAWINNVIAAN